MMDKAQSVFEILEQAAISKKRCPTNQQIAESLGAKGYVTASTSIPKITADLTREGRITVRVYAQNWREVVICTGPHKGATTEKPPPSRGEPYLVIDATERAKRDVKAGALIRRR